MSLLKLPAGEISLGTVDHRQGSPVLILSDTHDRQLPRKRLLQTFCRRIRIAGCAVAARAAMTRELGRIDPEQTDAFALAAERIAIDNRAATNGFS